MSERKVLNKYYPPDFDPNKIPRLKRPKNRQFSIRIMAPFNMRCSNCGEYIYKGKKFNSRQERVEDEDYLGLMIFRFYIKCPRCVAEISFKTDPQNCDYALEAGATRNFEALRTAERLAEQELKEKEEEEKNNPMKVLENRTKASQQEMEMLETLEELRELNSRHAKVDHEEVLRRHKAYEEQLRQLQDEEDEQFIQSIFGKSISGETVKRVHDEDDVKDDGESFSSISLPAKIPCIRKPTDILTEGSQVTTKDSEISSSTQDKKPAPAKINKDASSWQKSIGSLSKKNSLLGIVKKKKSVKTSSLSADKSPAEQLKDERTRTENSETTATTTTACYGVKDSVNDSAAVSRDVNKSNESRQIEAVDGKGASSKPSALGMLGAYSDTSSDDSN